MVAIWMRLPRLIKKKMSLKFWKGDHYKNKIYNNYKYIYIYIYINLKKMDPGGHGPHLGLFLPVRKYISYVGTGEIGKGWWVLCLEG